ncbi:tyrosine-type recombinase/integrase [Rugamonas sp. A1-17]|nr:tyrosine-type recombinase/integrase [Rugamonas sp. A1-17]
MKTQLELWDLDPVGSFAQFVQSLDFIETSSRQVDQERKKPLSKQSALVYRTMFGKYARWLSSRGTAFSRASHYELLMFIELGSVVGNKRIPDLNSKISYRYLRLIERCYLYLKVSPNPAQHAIFGALKQQRYFKDKSMVTLTSEQLDRFVAALPSSTEPSEWRRRRDRAMQLVMLFGGLRVSEVIGMLMTEIGRQAEMDGSLQLHLTTEFKSQSSYEHSTFLRTPAVEDVLAWIAERAALPITGDLAFPSYNGSPLDQATVYRHVKATLRAAKIELPRSGGRTLRNTFAVQELKQGTQKPELTKQLGLALERSTDTYEMAGRRE